MRKRKRPARRRFARPLCDSFGPDDGIDPREWAKGERATAPNRKALQLCRQVEQTLHLALAGCGDLVLQDLLVLSVVPFPDSTRLLVTVESATGISDAPAVVHARLRHAARALRVQVAGAVHRRKTPDLVFRVA